MIINWMKYRKIYAMVSGTMVVICIYGLFTYGLKLGVDFTGGSVIEYQLNKEVSTDELIKTLQDKNYEVNTVRSEGENKYAIKLGTITQEEKNNITEELKTYVGEDITELRFENVGPTVGPELIKKTIYAILIASAIILGWIAFQFKNFKFGVSAIFAMFHDSFILVGAFSLLGKYAAAEMDFLVVTAVLTTLSFSVHDTIVVYDRIRELQKKRGGNIYELANLAISETMVRSLNNSFTILFMLIALLLMGGATIKWFAAALLIGTILGTYSSPFVAVPLLVTWDELEKKIKR